MSVSSPDFKALFESASGLCLATIRRVVHRHDGRVRAEGAADGGARFYFTL